MEDEGVVEEVEVAVFVAEEVVEEELGVLPDDASVFPTMLVLLMIEHTALPDPVTHSYPNGQQLLPHDGKLSPSLVVKIPAVGLEVAFCDDTSHLIGWMLSHEFDSGQHSAEDEVSRDTQLFPEGHVKVLGNLGSTAEQDTLSLARSPGSLGGLVSKADVEDKIAAAIKMVRTVYALAMCMTMQVYEKLETAGRTE